MQCQSPGPPPPQYILYQRILIACMMTEVLIVLSQQTLTQHLSHRQQSCQLLM